MRSNISRRSYLLTTGAIAGTVGFAGCLGGGAGMLSTQVSDQPGDIGDFESCVITIAGMWLGPEDAEAGDGESAESSEREYFEYDEPQAADLVDLQGEPTQLIDERDIDVGTYAFLQLDVESVDATLDDGSDTTVEVPGEAPLTFNQEFEVREGIRTTFTADFTPVARGGAGGYVLNPVPDETSVAYGDAE